MNDVEKLKDEIIKRSKPCGISSDEVKLVKNYVDNKIKDDSSFVCEGLWATEKIIDKNIKISKFYFNINKIENNLESEENLRKILKLIKFSENSYAISEKSCKKISDRDGFDEYFIIAKQPKITLDDLEKMLSKNNNVLGIVMDGLEQPGNIGAILRSFDSAGGTFAIITNKKASLTNSRLVRASLGASFMLPSLECEISTLQNWLVKNNFKCIVTDLQAKKSFKDANYDGRVVIVAGNEHTGISDSWRKLKSSESVIIPMLGSVESLNVGFASTLVAYEAGLQKFTKN